MFMNWGYRLPLLRKLTRIGNSRFVSLPADWLAFYEREFGEEIKEVAITMEGRFLTISPYFKKENQTVSVKKKGSE